MGLYEGLRETAANYPEKVALGDPEGRALTFSQLDRNSGLAATRLSGFGVEPGDRVALMCSNRIDAIVVFWGIVRLGATAVWIDEKRPLDDIQLLLSHCNPSLVVCGDYAQASSIQSRVGPEWSVQAVQTIADADAKGDDHTNNRTAVIDDDLAIIVYTSGSSGTPKGVCLSHRNLATVARAVIRHMPIAADDVYLMLVPLHYIHGLMQLLVHQFVGATIHLSEGFQFPRVVMRQIVDLGVRGFSGVPFHFSALMDRGGLLTEKLPDLRWVTVTGGKLSAAQIEKFTRAFPHVEFHIAYGQTECAPRATALHPSKIAEKPNSVGTPIPGVTVEVVDEDGHALPDGETGEIVVSGANVMHGYWNDPAGTAAVIDEFGRLHTGDLGHFDDDGDLYLDGRVSELLKTAGERVSPVQIEQVLTSLEWVQDAVVQSVDDDLYGQIIVAQLLLADSVQQNNPDPLVAQAHTLCVARCSLARSPRKYYLWKTMPLLASGKPDKKALAKASYADPDDIPELIRVVRPGH